jgi:hypothetical protein
MWWLRDHTRKKFDKAKGRGGLTWDSVSGFLREGKGAAGEPEVMPQKLNKFI